jgi:hypothetical protein
MDNGIWATWYNLPDDKRDTYLAWAHRSYLPFLKQVSGYAWVAHYRHEGGGPKMKRVEETVVGRTDEDVGCGYQYLVMVGAPSAHTFFKPALAEVELPDTFSKMLALREGVRTAIFTEEARLNGPAAAKDGPGSTPGPYIQMGSFRMRTVEQDFELGRWYAQFRMPYMAQMPGCIATRKLICVAGWAKHAVLYEFESAEVRLKNFEEPHESLSLDKTHWSSRITGNTVHTPGSPTIGPRIWPACSVASSGSD